MGPEGKTGLESFEFSADFLVLVGMEHGIPLDENIGEICTPFNLLYNNQSGFLEAWCERFGAN